MRKFIDNVFLLSTAFIVLIVIAWSEYRGISHAFEKHDDGVSTLFVPPLAWYHSVESFGHKDEDESSPYGNSETEYQPGTKSPSNIDVVVAARRGTTVTRKITLDGK